MLQKRHRRRIGNRFATDRLLLWRAALHDHQSVCVGCEAGIPCDDELIFVILDNFSDFSQLEFGKPVIFRQGNLRFEPKLCLSIRARREHDAVLLREKKEKSKTSFCKMVGLID